ncbi:hypothetical protein [Corynebacterium lubricantis]|uniref:hypothetical protein n=1 Tax=Corynebacterium lubricantis TaxID=541095 RepID=UPI00035F491C|nr:hypothetical protein [Corynebacterium lubricantis]
MKQHRARGKVSHPRGFLAGLLATATLIAGCAPAEPLGPYEQARVHNQNRSVSADFAQHPVVVEDPFGFETSQLFFPSSEILVVVDETTAAALRGASVALVTHAPMLVYKPEMHREVVEEIRRLGAHTVLTVGKVSLAPASGSVSVIRDPGGLEALGTMTAYAFDEVVVESPDDAVQAVASVGEQEQKWLRASWADPEVAPQARAAAVPASSPRDADMAPKVVATHQSDLAAVVNARSYGADVDVVDDPNPVTSDETFMTMVGLEDQPLLALGQEFGTDEELRSRIRGAEAIYMPN